MGWDLNACFNCVLGKLDQLRIVLVDPTSHYRICACLYCLWIYWLWKQSQFVINRLLNIQYLGQLTCICLTPPLRVNVSLEWRTRRLLRVNTSPGWGRLWICTMHQYNILIPMSKTKVYIYVSYNIIVVPMWYGYKLIAYMTRLVFLLPYFF